MTEIKEKRYIICCEFHSKTMYIRRCDNSTAYRRLEKKYLLAEGGTAEECLEFAKAYEKQGYCLAWIED